jgi:hypothetical protein
MFVSAKCSLFVFLFIFTLITFIAHILTTGATKART